MSILPNAVQSKKDNITNIMNEKEFRTLKNVLILDGYIFTNSSAEGFGWGSLLSLNGDKMNLQGLNPFTSEFNKVIEYKWKSLDINYPLKVLKL